MKTLRLAFLFASLFLLFFQSAHAQRSNPLVLVLDANTPVGPAMQAYIARGIQVAKDRQAELLVLELNTPGGDAPDTTLIATAIRASSVPVVVYVAPQGAMAASAGTIITLAGDASAMAPQTVLGAATPVDQYYQDLSSTEKAKVENLLQGQVRSLAAGRSPQAIQLALTTIYSSTVVSANEAKSAGLVDFIATDLPDLLHQLDGYSIQMADGKHIVYTANATTEEIPLAFFEQILDILTDSNISFLLLAVGLQAILIELSNPGGWIPGFIGVVALALAAYGMGVLSVNWFGLVFILLAFVLFILDIKAPTHGALTIAGVGSFILGALILFNSPGTPQFQQVSVPLVVVTGIVIGLLFAVALGFALRAQRTPLRMGRELLVGQRGLAEGDISPHGEVQLKSELWSADLADSNETIHAGDKVEVVSVEGLRLKVRKIK